MGMIDPKLNEIPVKQSPSNLQSDSRTEAIPEHATQARQGLSIQDTIAGDNTMSVGGRGVDTSGVRAGAGAGAGTATVTPATRTSPAPEIVPGARLNSAGQSSIDRSDTGVPGTGHTESSQAGSSVKDEPTQEEIAMRAHEIWLEQGCPSGSCESDWLRAEIELRRARRAGSRAAAASV